MHSNKKHSFEEKIYIINLIDNNHSVASVARDLGINKNLIFRWKRQYNSKGIEGLRRRPTHTRYSQDFKDNIIQEHIRDNISFSKLAAKYELCDESMVANWFRDYTIGKKTYPNRNQRNQKMKDGRKTTRIERIEIAQWTIANNYAYHEAADHFKVSYQQVYTWVKKLNNGGTDALSDRRGRSKSTPLSELDKAKLEIKELKARNKYLEMEKDLSKKLRGIQGRVK